MFEFIKNKISIILWAGVTLIVIGGLVAGNILAVLNADLITKNMSGMGLNYGSPELDEAIEDGFTVAEMIQREGIVLVKNENDALPLKGTANETGKTEYKVNVFGWAGTDKGFIFQGGGSGRGTDFERVTFLEALKLKNIRYNEPLASAYAELPLERKGEFGSQKYYDDYFEIIEAETDFLSDERIARAKVFSDTALVVLSRRSAEGFDLPGWQRVNGGDKDFSKRYPQISEPERRMLEKVGLNFDKVIVIINSTNAMELGFAENDDVDAVLVIGNPGNRGTLAVADVLIGSVNPSGKLVDTYAYDMSTAPSFPFAGREGTRIYSDYGSQDEYYSYGNRYTDYAEDIYFGYFWYETADAEGYWDNVNNDYGKGYRGIVQYPFGYGLSYTDFSRSFVKAGLPDGSALDKNEKITFEVAVENIGKTAGAEAVQLYYTPYYKKGGIEKPAVRLGAFAKTKLLQPGEIEIVTLQTDVEDMKSYDAYDRNNNGFMGYELDAGDYEFSLRTDAHTPAKIANSVGKTTYTYKIPGGGYRYENDSVTGYKVENRFTNYKNTLSGAESKMHELLNATPHSIDGNDEPVKIEYLTRADFSASVRNERPPVRAMGKLLDDTFFIKNLYVNDTDVMPKTDYRFTNYKITDMFGLEYGDVKWNDLICQLSVDELGTLVIKGGYGTVKIGRIDKPKAIDFDGPSGFNHGDFYDAVNYPCETVLAQTFNWKLSYQMGLAIGKEGNILGVNGWYAPGVNMHRSPMNGRNFEYYSEDPVLSGIMAAHTVLGAKENGIYCYIKHFVANDSETGRNGSYRWMTEQNLRENYMKPFEIAVKKGGANAMMTSYDRIGAVRTSGSYELLTEVARNEWGFRGSIVSEYSYQDGKTGYNSDFIHDVDECIRAGNDLMLCNGTVNWFDDVSSPTAVKALQKSAKNILYTYADTLTYNETAKGLELGSTNATRAQEVFPWWIVIVVSVNIIVLAGCGLLGVLVIRRYTDEHK